MMLPKNNLVEESNFFRRSQQRSIHLNPRSHRLSTFSCQTGINWDVHTKRPPPSLCNIDPNLEQIRVSTVEVYLSS